MSFASGAGSGEEDEGALRQAEARHDAEDRPPGGEPLQHVQPRPRQLPDDTAPLLAEDVAYDERRRRELQGIPVLRVQHTQGEGDSGFLVLSRGLVRF